MRILYSYQGKQRTFTRDTTQVVIGRPKYGLDVDLDLTPDQYVSRPHARVWLEDGRYWIEDLNSAPGTLVGKEEIKQKGKRQLRAGDTFRIGQTTLEVEIPGESDSVRFSQAPEPDADIAETLDARVSAFVPLRDASGETSRRLSFDSVPAGLDRNEKGKPFRNKQIRFSIRFPRYLSHLDRNEKRQALHEQADTVSIRFPPYVSHLDRNE